MRGDYYISCSQYTAKRLKFMFTLVLLKTRLFCRIDLREKKSGQAYTLTPWVCSACLWESLFYHSVGRTLCQDRPCHGDMLYVCRENNVVKHLLGNGVYRQLVETNYHWQACLRIHVCTLFRFAWMPTSYIKMVTSPTAVDPTQDRSKCQGLDCFLVSSFGFLFAKFLT